MKIDLSAPQSDLLAAIHDAGETGMVVPGTKGSTAKVLRSYELIATIPDTEPPKQRATASGAAWMRQHKRPSIFPRQEDVPEQAWAVIRPIVLAFYDRQLGGFQRWMKVDKSTWPIALFAFPVEGEDAIVLALHPMPLVSAIKPGRRRITLFSYEESPSVPSPIQWREKEHAEGFPTEEIVREVLRWRKHLDESRATARRCKGARGEADRLNKAVGVDPTNSIADVRADVRVSTGELLFMANVDCTPEQAEAMLDCAKRVGLIPETSR